MEGENMEGKKLKIRPSSGREENEGASKEALISPL